MQKSWAERLTVRSCYGHLGGKFGNQLFARLLELGWFEPMPDRSTVYLVTDKGAAELKKLGIKLD